MLQIGDFFLFTLFIAISFFIPLAEPVVFFAYDNKNLKDDFEMGYDRAKKFIDKLEELGIVTKQRARLPREVVLNKAQAFLKERGYSCDVTEDAANQNSASDIASVQVEEHQELSEEKPAATIFMPIRKSDYESVKPMLPTNATPIPVIRRKSAKNK